MTLSDGATAFSLFRYVQGSILVISSLFQAHSLQTLYSLPLFLGLLSLPFFVHRVYDLGIITNIILTNFQKCVYRVENLLSFD